MKTIPNIPKVYSHFPKGYINDVRGWGFDQETIAENVGKLLTLDIDFGELCTLNCPSCFRKNNTVDSLSEQQLSYDELVQIILDAKKLGLRSVKFLGAGDPFENHRFLEFLRFLKSQDVTPLIFTKGHVIGDDDLVEKYFSYLGIKTGEVLVRELDKCDVSIMLGFNSFDDEIQAKLVGASVEYVKARNRTLELLVDKGFASSSPTRIALAANPITKANIYEAFEIYKWGRLRNFYVIATPTMISGRAKKEATWKAINPSRQELVDLYVKIYSFNIDNGLQTLDTVISQGVSAYAGGHPCNQVSTGMYVTLGGTVLSCPGDVNVEGNVFENDLKDIWEASSNYQRKGTYNNQCIAKDGKSLPDSLYSEVLEVLKSIYGGNDLNGDNKIRWINLS